MKYEYCSGFACFIRSFLKNRYDMGYSITDYGKLLANFDQFCNNIFPNETYLSKEIAFAWCNDAKGIGKGGFNRASALRCFAKYILQTGGSAYSIPPTFFPMPKAKQPVIMNQVELERFFKATDCCVGNSQDIMCKYTIPVIFRLQYACGMRPQEVRGLRCVDFDYMLNTINIVDGKHHKDRCLPINENAMEMCKQYNRLAEKMLPNRTYFFQTQFGKAYSSDWLCNIFHKCWEISGNEINRGTCTPYVLRHNYATQILMSWIEDGKNLNAMIPYLSSYMGHEKFSSTYYYIHLLPERLSHMDFTHDKGIIPEVHNYEEA